MGSLNRAADGAISTFAPVTRTSVLAASRQSAHHELLQNSAQNAEVRKALEEKKREVRDIRAEERKLKWSIERQDKKEAVVVTRAMETELRDWRWREKSDMKTYMEGKANANKAMDLQESKHYQEFKREVKAAKKEEDKAVIQEIHQQDIEHAALQAALAQEQHERDQEVKIAKCESVLFQKEARARSEIEGKIQEDHNRQAEQNLELESLKRQLDAKRASFLESLELTRAAAKAPPRTARMIIPGAGRGLHRA